MTITNPAPELQSTVTASSTVTQFGAESDIQATARNLYERGFNVFPLPTAHDWLLRADKDNVTKHPYPVKMQKVYASRLHFDNSFIELFDRSNIGVMCGRTSGNLIALDCDTQRSFEYVGMELTARAIPFWAITSHRGGAYLLRLIEGEAKNVTKQTSRINDVEIWGNSHYVVLPPSVHPSGDVYQWKSPEPRFCLPRYESIPVVSVIALEWLGVTTKSSYQPDNLIPESARPSWAKNISRANVEAWMNGAQDGSRNTRLTSLAYDLAGNGIAKQTAVTVLLEASARCTPPYPERESKAIVKSAYKKANVTPARSYYGENVSRAKTWQTAAEFAESFDWHSRQWTYTKRVKKKVVTSKLQAHSVKRVFLALIERAKLDGRPTFRATIRETSMIADLNKDTVCHALQALAHAELVRRAKNTDCNLFEFVDYSQFRTLTITCRNSVRNWEYSKLPKTHTERDLFGAGHLFTVWRHLLVNPERNAYQTAKALKVSPSIVYSAFRKLQSMMLVTFSQAEGLYFGESRTETALQMLAIEYGKDGRSKGREEKYRIERARYLNQEFAKAKKRYALESQRLRDKRSSPMDKQGNHNQR